MLTGEMRSSKELQKPCAKSMYKLITTIFLFAPALEKEKKNSQGSGEMLVCSWALGF